MKVYIRRIRRGRYFGGILCHVSYTSFFFFLKLADQHIEEQEHNFGGDTESLRTMSCIQLNLNGVMLGEQRRAQLLTIDYFTRDPPRDSDKNYSPVSRPKHREKGKTDWWLSFLISF